jgi:hypothetical protein
MNTETADTNQSPAEAVAGMAKMLLAKSHTSTLRTADKAAVPGDEQFDFLQAAQKGVEDAMEAATKSVTDAIAAMSDRQEEPDDIKEPEENTEATT